MDIKQFAIIEERLKHIELLLLNIQPKKRPRQTKLKDERPFEQQVQDHSKYFAPSMLTDFILYWSEKDRWKKEKVFDIPLRLKRWQRQQEKWDWEKSQKQELKKIEEKPVEKIERQNTGFTKLFS